MSAIQQREEPAETPEVDIAPQARMCLAGVARLQGDWGLHMVADVLRGSEKKRVVDVGLDELSIHGLLDCLTRAKILAMLRELLDAGLICRGAHDCVGLTPLGTAVMLEKRPLPTHVARALETAHREARAPHSSTKYNVRSPSVQQTLMGLRRGQSPWAIAKSRDLAHSTIVDHLLCLAAHGERFDLTPHLDVLLLEELRRKAAGWKPGDPLTPVRDALDEEECPWDRLKLHLVQIFRE